MARLFGLGSFYGETKSLTIAGATFSEVRHERPIDIPAHTHEAGHFCLLLDGTYVERSGAVTIAYEPLTVAFLPPKVAHADTVGEGGCRFFIVELTDAWMETVASYGPVCEHLTDLHGGVATWLAVRLYNEYRNFDSTSQIVVESLLYELCGHIYRMKPDETEEPPWLHQTREKIENDFASHLELTRLAADADVHPCHLARTFRRRYGVPVGEYVARLRIQLACRSLANASLPLAQVAADAGFTDQSHLTRVFKSVTGMTPAVYRRRH